MIEDVWTQTAKNLGIPAWYLDEPLWSWDQSYVQRKSAADAPLKKSVAEILKPNLKVQISKCDI